MKARWVYILTLLMTLFAAAGAIGAPTIEDRVADIEARLDAAGIAKLPATQPTTPVDTPPVVETPVENPPTIPSIPAGTRWAAPPVITASNDVVRNWSKIVNKGETFDGGGKTYYGTLTINPGGKARNFHISGAVKMSGGTLGADIQDVEFLDGSPFGIDGTGILSGQRLRFSYISDPQGYVMILSNGVVTFSDVAVKPVAPGKRCGVAVQSILRYEDIAGTFTRLNIIDPTIARASVRGGTVGTGVWLIDSIIYTPPMGGFGPANRLAENDGGQRLGVKEWRVWQKNKDGSGQWQTWYADNTDECYKTGLNYFKAHPNATRKEVSKACLAVARNQWGKCGATDADLDETFRVRDAKILGGGRCELFNTLVKGPGVALEAGATVIADAKCEFDVDQLISGTKPDYPDPKAPGGDARLPGDPKRGPATLTINGSKVIAERGIGIDAATASKLIKGKYAIEKKAA